MYRIVGLRTNRNHPDRRPGWKARPVLHRCLRTSRLRQPAMLAKTSATLDLLSGGRFELGLGGGRLWPQIAGLGGPALTPGEVVTAVDEAMTVLRALWTPDRVANFHGQRYSL